MVGWILGLGIPTAWVACWLWAWRIWFDRAVRRALAEPSTYSRSLYMPDGADLAFFGFFCFVFAPAALVAGVLADWRTGKGFGWFAPTLQRQQHAKERRETMRAQAAEIRAAARGQDEATRAALLMAADSLEQQMREATS